MSRSEIKCSIDECGRPVSARGFCHMHYRRWHLFGDPLAGGPFKARKGEIEFFINVAKAHESDECLLWPFARNSAGYAHFVLNGKHTLVHRVICEHVNGAPTDPAQQAAHTCGNGKCGCISPKHLLWKSPLENAADTILHGRSQRGSRNWCTKLSNDDVLAIRVIAASQSQTAVARMFGITQSNVSCIVTGKSWGWLNSPHEPEDGPRPARKRKGKEG